MNDSIFSKLSDKRLIRVAKDLLTMLWPAIRLKTFQSREDELPLGATRIGGKPDLTDDVIWPFWRDKPLAFLAQINLQDLTGYTASGFLLNNGWLLFFYDSEQSTWGFDPQDKGSWAVVFMQNEGAKLQRRGFPSDILVGGFYRLCRVEMAEVLTIPPVESAAIEALNFNWAERDAYMDLLEEVYSSDEPSHQIPGYPQPIQGDMQLECQLVSNGLYCGNPTGYNDPRAKELKNGVDDWRLLFQLDTDDNAAMMWGDVGRLYFWIKQQDLDSRSFDKSWMILQCY